MPGSSRETLQPPYVESIHSKLTSQPVKARSPVRLRNEYVEMIDAKLSSKRKTHAAAKVKVQTSGKDKNEYVEKLHAKLSTKRPCEHHHHGKRKREWISSALKKVSQLCTHCRVLYGVVVQCTTGHFAKAVEYLIVAVAGLKKFKYKFRVVI